MSSGNDGVFHGCSSRPRRRIEATPAGPETRSTASRARAYRSACQAWGDIWPGPGRPAAKAEAAVGEAAAKADSAALPRRPICSRCASRSGAGHRRLAVVRAGGGRVLPGLGFPGRAVVAEGAEDQVDHLVEGGRVHGPGDDGHDHRVARGRLGVLAGQVAALAEQRPDPHVLKAGRARHRAQVPQRDVGHDLRVGARAVGDELGPQEQLAGQLQRVVEPLGLAAAGPRGPPSCRGPPGRR